MATLTVYTAALQTISTQTFGDTLKRIIYAPGNGHAADIYTLDTTGGPTPGLLDGHVYGLTVDGNPNAIYAKLTHADVDDDGCSLQFERLSADASEIVKAVLDNLDSQEQKPEGESYTLADLHAMQDRINRQALRFGTKPPGAFSFTWDRNSPWPVWREGEGNNP